jgi:metal-dependent amidase/aminoacylase/carboxypeptidase family protein
MKQCIASLLGAAALGAFSLLPAHAEMDVPRLKAAIEASLEADYPKLDALYRDIHAHPELAFDAAVVATAEKALKAAFGDKARTSPPNTPSEDFSEYGSAGVPSMMFNMGVYDLEQWTAANKAGTPLPPNHSPLFAPVPKPTISTGVSSARSISMPAGNDDHPLDRPIWSALTLSSGVDALR